MKWSIVSVGLLRALVCVACVSVSASALPEESTLAGVTKPARPASSEAEEAASVAREALARIRAGERLNDIGDARLRRIVQTTYRALVELADNHDPARVAMLNSKFERAYASLECETARGVYKTCADNCKACDGKPCRSRCKATGKKFCGCKIVVFACVVAECIF